MKEGRTPQQIYQAIQTLWSKPLLGGKTSPLFLCAIVPVFKRQSNRAWDLGRKNNKKNWNRGDKTTTPLRVARKRLRF